MMELGKYVTYSLTCFENKLREYVALVCDTFIKVMVTIYYTKKVGKL